MWKIMQKHYLRSNSGQSLVEVLVALSLVSLVLVALISAISYSLANAQYSRNKTLATKYAQEIVEWLREERSNSWFDFYNSRAGVCADITSGSCTGTTYCFETLSWPATVGACSVSQLIDGLFRRDVTLTQSGTSGAPENYAKNAVKISVTVTWTQGTKDREVVLDTFLTKWL